MTEVRADAAATAEDDADDRPAGTGGLGGSASRGAAVTLAGQLGRIAVQLLGIVVLARLLLPADYGLLAMVLAIIGIGDLIRDFGLSFATVQARSVSAGQRTNLFWINTGIGGALAVLVFALSWPIAALYGRPELQPLTAVLSVTFLLSGAATQYRANLNRSLRFARLTTAEITGQAAGLGLAIWAALGGWGYWALAVQQVVPVVVQLLLVVLFTRWNPGLPKRGVPMRDFLSFGMTVAAVQSLTYASRNVDSVVLGATVGPGALGLYNRAFQLMLLPLNQLNAPSTRVALPVLSRLQDQPARFAEFLRVGQAALLGASGFVIAYCTAQAGPIILIALGPRWEGTVPLFQILAVAGFFTTLGYTNWWVFLAKGLSRANLSMALVTRSITIAAILAGSLGGVYGVAIAYAASCVIGWPIALLWLRRVSNAPVAQMFAGGLRAAVVFTVAGAASWGVCALLPPDALWLRLAVGTPVFVAVLALLALVYPAYRAELQDLWRLRRYFTRRRAGTAGTGATP